MRLFWTDSIALCCANVVAAKKWWIDSFGCKEASVPLDWDNSLPSDVALTLPGDDEPTILLSDRAEVEAAGYDRANGHVIIFCSKPTKAHEHLQRKGVAAPPIQHTGGTEFFEVRDPEGNAIEICKEP